MSELLRAIQRAVAQSRKTRYRIAQESGVSQGQLSRLMSGQQGLSLDSLERIAEALDLEIVVRPKQRTRKVK